MAVTERFYSRHFGFQRARVIPIGDTQIIYLRAGAFSLELFQAEKTSAPPPAKDGPTGASEIRHLAFQVDDVEAKLKAMGDDAKITQGPMDFSAFIDGWKTVWVQDPDGRIVEISQGYTDQENPPQLA